MRSSVLAWHVMTAQVPEPPAPADGVQWSAAPGCPDRAALLAGISRRLGRPLEPGQVAVDARVARTPGPRFALRLRLVAGERSELRELTANACAPLLDATALLIVHALEAAADEPLPPDVVTIAPQDTLTPEPPPPDGAIAPQDTLTPEPPVAGAPADPDSTANPTAPPGAPTPDPLEPAAPPPSSRGPGLLLRVHGGPELGALPKISGLVGLGVGVLWRRVRLEARGSFLAPRTATTAQTDVRGLLVVGSLHGCARLGGGALEFPVCAGLEAGALRGEAHGPTADGTTLAPWLGVVLGAGVAWRLRPRLALWAALEGVGGAVRPRFLLRDPGDDITLFRPAAVSGRLLLGLELRIRDPR